MGLDLRGFYQGLEDSRDQQEQMWKNVGYLAAEGMDKAGERRQEALLKGEKDPGLLGWGIAPKWFGSKARRIDAPISRQELGQMNLQDIGGLTETGDDDQLQKFEGRMREKLGKTEDETWDFSQYSVADLPLEEQETLMKNYLNKTYGGGTVTGPDSTTGSWKQDKYGDYYKDIEAQEGKLRAGVRSTAEALIPGGKHGFLSFDTDAGDTKSRVGYGKGQWAPGKLGVLGAGLIGDAYSNIQQKKEERGKKAKAEITKFNENRFGLSGPPDTTDDFNEEGVELEEVGKQDYSMVDKAIRQNQISKARAEFDKAASDTSGAEYDPSKDTTVDYGTGESVALSPMQKGAKKLGGLLSKVGGKISGRGNLSMPQEQALRISEKADVNSPDYAKNISFELSKQSKPNAMRTIQFLVEEGRLTNEHLEELYSDYPEVGQYLKSPESVDYGTSASGMYTEEGMPIEWANPGGK